MNVRLVDLARLHAPIRPALDAAIARTLDSARFVLGEEVAAFEREVANALGVSHAVGVSSGSDAILAALWADGVGAGDEVITPAFGFAAAAEAIARLGATPVFAEIGADLNLDPRDALARRTPRTRAVLAIDLFGRRADYVELAAAGVPVFEDAAQAIGASVGRGVRAAAISFFPTKNLGALGDGGLVVTEDPVLASTVRNLRAHGATTKYVHERVGWNMRLDALQAAVLRVKLQHLAAWNDARLHIADAYREGLTGVPDLALPAPAPGHVFHQYVVRTSQRDALRAHLTAAGVETEVYYPLALHIQPCFAELGGRVGHFPRSEEATRTVLALPIHPMLVAGEIAHVVGSIRAFFGVA